MREIIQRAGGYIRENGTPLQKACLDFLEEKGTKDDIVKALSPYQNEDGGWANGLEIEYPGLVSSPYTTAVALGLIHKFSLSEHGLLLDTLDYLKSTQLENGMWDDTPQMLQFPHPPYMGPGVYTEYKTGMILKGLLRLNVHQTAMIDRAITYMADSFEEISKRNDFWSAVAYSGAFSFLPHHPKYPQIMEWSMKLLMPEGAGFGWQQAMGMIEDDIPIPETVQSLTLELIQKHQEPDGGWPHLFGTYNRVWSAIYIVRFLLKNI